MNFFVNSNGYHIQQIEFEKNQISFTSYFRQFEKSRQIENFQPNEDFRKIENSRKIQSVSDEVDKF